MNGLRQVKHRQMLFKKLAACALAAPMLMVGCTKTNEASYRVLAGQREVPLALDSDVHKFTFFGMKQAIKLTLSAPLGTKFVASDAKTYSLPLAVGQQQKVYFDVVSDGSLVEGKRVDSKRVELLAEGYERVSSSPLPFETRIWSKAPNNKPYTPTLLSVQYRYALAATQTSMELNLGNFRNDPKSHFLVSGKSLNPILSLKAAPDEEFIFSPGTSFRPFDSVPKNATKANEYRVRMAPGQEFTLNFWIAGRSQHVQPQTVTVQYTLSP